MNKAQWAAQVRRPTPAGSQSEDLGDLLTPGGFTLAFAQVDTGADEERKRRLKNNTYGKKATRISPFD